MFVSLWRGKERKCSDLFRERKIIGHCFLGTEKKKGTAEGCPIEEYGRVLASLNLCGTDKVSQSRLDFLKPF